MMKRILSHLTPSQRVPLAGSKTPQVRNHAGGYGWSVDPWQRLRRFLILGSDGGTYHVSERALTVENATAVTSLLAQDGERVVKTIVGVSTSGAAPRAGPAVLALALALKRGDLATRRAAGEAVPVVCRTGTHLFQLAEAVQALGGWGRGTKRAFAQWYEGKDAAEVVFQALKYAQREGWTHRDVLRLAHPKPADASHQAVYRWIVEGDGALPVTSDGPLERALAVRALREATSVGRVVELVQAYRLPREVVPSVWLREPDVWRALLYGSGRGMPMTALLRNLPTLTRVGLLAPLASETRLVCAQLTDADRLAKARIHPLALLVALETYRSGRSVRGKATWTPVPAVVDALDAAHDAAYRSVEPTGKRHLLALDVSGSMGWGAIAGLPGVTPAVASAALALVTAKVEPETHVVGFADTMRPLGITPRMRLDQALAKTRGLAFGATDCAQPMLWARSQGIEVDAFVVYTDNETWYGQVHPARALRDYREATGIDAKLVVVGMTATDCTIADPDDAGMLDVVGMDPGAPRIISAVIRGAL